MESFHKYAVCCCYEKNANSIHKLKVQKLKVVWFAYMQTNREKNVVQI